MNKLFNMIIISMMLIPMINAQQLDLEVDAGITPDSPFYNIDLFFDNLRITFSMSLASKAQTRLEIAEERLSEMKLMAETNNLVAMNKARSEHAKQLNAIELLMDEQEDDDLKVSFQEKLEKHIINLEFVKALVPEQAQEGLTIALENSERVFETNQQGISEDKRLTTKLIRQRIIIGDLKII